MRIGFFLPCHFLLGVCQNYLELKTGSPTLDYAPVQLAPIKMTAPVNDSSCFVLAAHPRDPNLVKVLISPEDYEKVAEIASTWRVSSSGYVVVGKRVQGKNKVTYLHKVVFGDTCTHINGNRLDNRRNNLTASKKRRRPTEMNKEDLLEFIDDPYDIKRLKDTSTTYPDGKIFFGETKNMKPHGFGMLVESKKRSIGWWIDGEFDSGIIMSLACVPSVMCDSPQILTFPPVRKAVLLHRNNRLPTL
jgi:hypothetical protein